MNTLRNAVRVGMAAGLLVLGLGMLQKVEAANPDTIKVYVTPTGMTYAVSITSPAVAQPGYDFDQVALGGSTISTLAIVVTNTGTVGEYWALKVSNSSPDNWAPLGADGTPGYNEFELLGRFVTTSAGQPADASFSGSDDIITGSYISSSGSKFGLSSSVLPPSGAGSSKDLYLKLIMPGSVSTGSEQNMTVTINGQAS